MVAAALSVPRESFRGDPKHFGNATTTTPGVMQSLLVVVNPDDLDRDLWQAIVVCRFEGKVEVFLDGVLIGSGRTGPGQSQAVIPWTPPYPSLSSQTIQILFTARPGSPEVPVEAYLSTAENEVP